MAVSYTPKFLLIKHCLNPYALKVQFFHADSVAGEIE